MSHDRKISVTGLGYVGLPVAVAFGKAGCEVVAYDLSNDRIAELRRFEDSTGELESADIMAANLKLTNDPADLGTADFHIVTVPTPITKSRAPDLNPLLSASKTVGKVLKKGDIVVYESTVYPGATEEDCVPVLEEVSGLECGVDFFVGYSPERINPGDKEHRFETITKVVSGQTPEILKIVAEVYASVVKAGVHQAPTIKVAEAAKVIENTQRDLNIALMNELSLIFHRLGIDTGDVLEAAGTKWNFLKFSPGLVGGHCIGVDPYYLTHRAEAAGYHPEVILAGRRTNDGMGAYVVKETVRHILGASRDGAPVVTVLGVTFKEDVPDVRNTRVEDIVFELKSFGIEVQIHDPMADPKEVAHEFDFTLTEERDLRPADAVILAVGHQSYRQGGWRFVQDKLRDNKGFVADVRNVLDRKTTPQGITLWRL